MHRVSQDFGRCAAGGEGDKVTGGQGECVHDLFFTLSPPHLVTFLLHNMNRHAQIGQIEQRRSVSVIEHGAAKGSRLADEPVP